MVTKSFAHKRGLHLNTIQNLHFWKICWNLVDLVCFFSFKTESVTGNMHFGGVGRITEGMVLGKRPLWILFCAHFRGHHKLLTNKVERIPCSPCLCPVTVLHSLCYSKVPSLASCWTGKVCWDCQFNIGGERLEMASFGCVPRRACGPKLLVHVFLISYGNTTCSWWQQDKTEPPLKYQQKTYLTMGLEAQRHK